MKIKNLKTFLLVFASICFFACSDDDNNTPEIGPVDLSNIETIIVNEGNYKKNNSMISGITKDKKVVKDLYGKANEGHKIGDSAQSVAIINDKIYVVLSRTKEVVVLDKDFKYIKSIKSEHFMGPQYIVQTSNKEAAVSDLYNGKIVFIDTEEDEILGDFTLEGNGKQLLNVNNKHLYVAKDNYIDIISIADKNLVKTLPLPVTSNSKLVLDKNGYVWALCCKYEDGWTTIEKEGNAYLAKINPNNLDDIQKIELDNSLYPQKFAARLETNKAKDKLYMTLWSNPSFKSLKDYQIVDGGKLGIFSLPINATEGLSSESEPLFWTKDMAKTNEKNPVEQLYNFAVTKDETIYICDAKDNAQNGALYEYSKDGKRINTFALTISPQYILFVNE
ncbi:YncE family protein [Dysgonomonas massiliensis]|uniref:YncE family protein n=1 Tax=Dysgonomonas massiliensis TaxID=2040292 RepID=UPI000C787149|nr:DUF5074 domain-containing protein [Dysgonomonas massiliensis]